MKRMIVFLLLLLGPTVWLVACGDKQRQSIDSNIATFQPAQPAQRKQLREIERQVYEQLKKEVAEKEVKEAAKKKGK